jgi:poly(hydroxyalkanoate) depolymerase family esterase
MKPPSFRRTLAHATTSLRDWLGNELLHGRGGARSLLGRSSSSLPSPAASFLTGSFTNSAGTRLYKLFVPSGYGRQPVPLIVMLHGCGQCAGDFAAGTRMNWVAEEETCIALYPEQAKTANQARCWNWYLAENQHRDGGEPLLVADLTRSVMSRYAIDRRRVYAAGLSAGGAAATILGALYPDLYAAIGVHSGLVGFAARDLDSALVAMRGEAPHVFSDLPATSWARRSPIPMIVWHGDADPMVHPINGDDIILRATGAGCFRKIVQRGAVRGGRAYTRTVYADANGRTMFEQWVVHGGAHAWSGGDPTATYTDPWGPDATRAIVRFFRQHARS